MAGVDTSIYNTTPPPPFNPLQTYGQVVGIQNAQQQNRLLQQQADMRTGLAQQYNAAVDPTTGQLNQNKLLAGSAADPRTAGYYGEINQQTQANTTATAAAQQEQLKNELAHIQAGNSFIGSLIGDPQLGQADLHDKIVKTINDMAAHGSSMMDPQTQANLIASIPHDPQGQLQMVRDKANQNLSMQGQIQQVLGGVQPIGTGAGTTLVRTPAAGGAPQQVGTLTNTTSPETQAQLVPTWVKQPDGTYQQVQVPRSTLPGASGVAGGGQPASPPQATPAPAAAPQMPGAAAPGNRLAAPAAAPVAPPAGPAPILAAPPPGVTSSQDADVTRYKADQALIPQHATNVQSLQKAQGALMAVGTGKGSGSLNTMLSYINTLDPSGTVAARIQNYDEAKKYLTDYARQQGAAAHSDLQLQAAEGSNASTDISNAAALDVVKTNIGRERQAIAQVQEQPNGTGIGYGKNAANFATSTDPRAFAWDQYTPDERTKILSGLKGAALQKFKDSIVIAARNGLISPPR